MLSVHKISFGFKNQKLFQDVSFDLEAGQLIRISGPNGSGKSTMLGLLSGIIAGSSGTISFAGDDDYRRWMSWVAPDANGLVSTLSATENLNFWLELRGIKLKVGILQTTLARWGLVGDWIQTSLQVAKFSTGMKRRLALARLELEDSKLWLLDEPLFGLDDAACKQFRDALDQHLIQGGASIVVTHDDRLLERIRHQTIFLSGAGS
jgi:heme exporter protein A